MAKPKGLPKSGGRIKGVPNKKTQSLFQICNEMNFDPFKAMVKIAQDDTHKDSSLMLKEVCQYLYPKRKSLEHSGTIDPQLQDAADEVSNMTKEEKIKLLQDQIKELSGR